MKLVRIPTDHADKVHLQQLFNISAAVQKKRSIIRAATRQYAYPTLPILNTYYLSLVRTKAPKFSTTYRTMEFAKFCRRRFAPQFEQETQ